MFVINEAELARFSKKIPKLWGTEYVVVNNDRYCLKLLKVIPGYRSSVHKHMEKDETFVGVHGCVVLTCYPEERSQIITAITPGRQFRIGVEMLHCFETHTESWVMEISTPHSDDDVVRSIPSKKLVEDEES